MELSLCLGTQSFDSGHAPRNLRRADYAAGAVDEWEWVSERTHVREGVCLSE